MMPSDPTVAFVLGVFLTFTYAGFAVLYGSAVYAGALERFNRSTDKAWVAAVLCGLVWPLVVVYVLVVMFFYIIMRQPRKEN
jgi:uncharacterized BrkB/YihY/UPF0761 family membrane protein